MATLTRLQTQRSFKPEQDGYSEGDGVKEGLCASAVAVPDPAPALQTTEHDLDPVASLE